MLVSFYLLFQKKGGGGGGGGSKCPFCSPLATPLGKGKAKGWELVLIQMKIIKVQNDS